MEKLKFVGRDKEIQQLKDFLQNKEKLVFLVAGRVGIGKTRLLEELTDSFIYGKDYVYPFKINRDETSESFLFRIFISLKKEHESFWTGDGDKWKKAIKQIPAVGGLIDALISKEDKRSLGLKFVDTLEYFARNTKKNERLIFVLDPEKYMHQDLKDSFITIWNNLPQEVKERVRFIIAQRPEDKLISDADFLNYHYVESFEDKLDFISIDDSKHIIESSAIANKLSSDQVEFLSKRCQGWPLAIDATIRMLERSSDIDKSIEELPEEPRRIIEALYENVKEPDAKEILYYLSLIPDFIELPELETIIKKRKFTTEFIYDMLHKKEVSALLDLEEVEEKREPGEKVKIFHPFFSEMLDSEMKKKRIYPAKCKNMADYYYKLWKKNERDIIALENIPIFYLKSGDEREYMEKVAEIAESKYRLFLLNSLINELIEALNISKKLKNNKYETVFLHKIGQINENMGNYDLALKHLQNAFNVAKEAFGDKHSVTASIYNDIGLIYERKGEYNEALDFHQKALGRYLDFFEKQNHQYIAASYNNIGVIYYRKGEYEKALEYYQKASKIMLNIFGENHPDTGATYNNIGEIFCKKGQYEKAIEFNEKALKISLNLYGENHPDTATSYNSIGLVYSRKGENRKALHYFNKALQIALMIYGKNHPYIASSYNNIGMIYDSLGEYNKALQYHKKALAIKLYIYGENHPDNATSYYNIGAVYFRKGDYDKALDFYQKAKDIMMKAYGYNHPYIAQCFNSIGLVYLKKHEFSKSVDFQNRSINILLKLNASDFPDSADYYSNLGETYFQKGYYDKSLKYYKKAFAIYNKLLGPRHPKSKEVRSNIEFIKEKMSH